MDTTELALRVSFVDLAVYKGKEQDKYKRVEFNVRSRSRPFERGSQEVANTIQFDYEAFAVSALGWYNSNDDLPRKHVDMSVACGG